MLYSVSETVHKIVLDGTATTTDVYTLVQFTGTLATAVFSVRDDKLLDLCGCFLVLLVFRTYCVCVCVSVCGVVAVWQCVAVCV